MNWPQAAVIIVVTICVTLLGLGWISNKKNR